MLRNLICLILVAVSAATPLRRLADAILQIPRSSAAVGGFILCDDYTELASKLFLLRDNHHWSGADTTKVDQYNIAQTKVMEAATNGTIADPLYRNIVVGGMPRDSFKSYHIVLEDVQAVFTTKYTSDLTQLKQFHRDMQQRRKLRNNIFHSANPLGTQVASRDCLHALCDLLDYACLLFEDDWNDALQQVHRLQVYKHLLHLYRKALTDITVEDSINSIMARRRCYAKPSSKAGIQIVQNPDDVHRHLCVKYDADQTLKVALEALLSSL